jgi:hypothetical protein
LIRFALCCTWIIALGTGLGPWSIAAEPVAAKKKAEPYPGNPQTIPYERVLDRADVVLSGQVQKLGQRSLVLTHVVVYKGVHKEKTATISFDGEWTSGIRSLKAPKIGKTGSFLCQRTKDGHLVLAGNPPKGGGYVEEGVALLKCLIEAGADPEKGYKSKSKLTRTSSTIRLGLGWLDAPADAKPQLPEDFFERLLEGLHTNDLKGRHVNAGARDCINRILKCNINKLFRYSVNDIASGRDKTAYAVKDAWEETVKAVKRRRSGAKKKVVNNEELHKHAQKLVAILGSDDFAVREAADKNLRQLGRNVLAAIEEGMKSKDLEVADRCKVIADFFKGKGKGDGGTRGPKIFDIDAAEIFVAK